MTQEIGFIEPRCKEESLDFGSLPVGTILTLYQYHSCDTASKYQVHFEKKALIFILFLILLIFRSTTFMRMILLWKNGIVNKVGEMDKAQK